MLNKMRISIEPILNKIASIFVLTKISPTGFSLIGLFFAVLSGLAYSGILGGWVIGGILIFVSGFFDIIDGTVARLTKSVSLYGSFIDSNFDRISEVIIYGGILLSKIGDPLVIFSTLSLSLMVSYARAKGESLNIKLSGIGIGERAERLIILAIASIIGYPYFGIILILILTIITYIQRMVFIITELKK